MEMEAAAMDFNALSRRELQALCKRNGVRANMTNAAMAEALQALTTVDGIDEIGTTLCLQTPGKSAMKSAAKVPGVEQQHGSPLPRGRRVSVKSPEAIRMEVEEGDDEVKRDLVKEIVRTPGVALRSTSRRARAMPELIPTPAPASSVRATTRRTAARKTEEVVPTPATLRRSQRTATRKAAEPVGADQRAEDMSAAKRTTRRSATSKVMMALDQEVEVAAAAPKEEKAQQEEPKDVASDVKCDDPEEEVTKLLDGDNKEEELEEGEEADSSDAAIGSAVVSDKICDDHKVEEVTVVVEEEAAMPQEGIVEVHEPISVEEASPLTAMEDSPILGTLSKAEAAKPVIEKAQEASVEDESSAEWSPAREMTEEVAVNEESVKDDGFTVTCETDHSPKEILLATDDLSEEQEGAADEMLRAELTDDDTSEEDDLNEDEDCTSNDDETAEEIDFTDESDEDNDETNEESDCTEVSCDFDGEKEELVQMLQETAIAEEANGDGSAEEDDFTSDLPPEFNNVAVFSDAETESDITLQVLEENQAAAASSTKTAVKTLDEFTIKKLNIESEAVAQKQLQVENLNAMSLRKLRVTLKECLAAKEGKKKQVAEGKRLALVELDVNACVDDC
ncbi:uncharacterized protein LOC133921461 isoform X2 [Phragmites australis]|uniref:uncharacterized protein LOC133921461 isoform X2 n=1 Tax=Phragmites australis TaxID=29695 RepID=UPI002D794C51|nr:uncharacterized protein LOC133921461 isoform X2 [Phragmites australis]